MYYSYVRSPGKPFLNEYFGTECDFVNLLTLMRMKKYDISKSLFESLLMPEYRLGLKTVCECFTKKELNPKARGKMHFLDSEDGSRYYRKNISREIIAAYKQAVNYVVERIRELCLSRGADYLLVGAEDSIGDMFFNKLVGEGVLT